MIFLSTARIGPVSEAFEVLRIHMMFVERGTVHLGVLQIDYLSHVISAQGVSMDMQKVESGLNWSQPTTLKGLRGSLA